MALKQSLLILLILALAQASFAHRSAPSGAASYRSYVAPMVSALKGSKLRERLSRYPALGRLAELENVLTQDEPRIRLETHPDEARLLIETLKEDGFYPEAFGYDPIYGLNGLYLERFLDAVGKTGAKADGRFEKLSAEVVRRTEAPSMGENGLAIVEIYRMSEEAQALYLSRHFLSEVSRRKLPALRLRIQDGVNRFEEKVEAWRTNLKKVVDFESPDRVERNPIGWDLAGGEGALPEGEKITGSWHSDDLGPTVAFTSREEALSDRIDRLERAPLGPWLKPLLVSTREYLKDLVGVLDSSFREENSARIKLIERHLNSAWEKDSPQLKEAVEDFRSARRRGKVPSAEVLVPLMAEVARLNDLIVENEKGGAEDRVSPGMLYRIERVLRDGGRIEGFPSWKELREQAEHLVGSWKIRDVFHRFGVILTVSGIFSTIIYYGALFPTFWNTLAVQGIVGAGLAFLGYFTFHFLPRLDRIERIESQRSRIVTGALK